MAPLSVNDANIAWMNLLYDFKCEIFCTAPTCSNRGELNEKCLEQRTAHSDLRLLSHNKQKSILFHSAARRRHTSYRQHLFLCELTFKYCTIKLSHAFVRIMMNDKVQRKVYDWTMMARAASSVSQDVSLAFRFIHKHFWEQLTLLTDMKTAYWFCQPCYNSFLGQKQQMNPRGQRAAWAKTGQRLLRKSWSETFYQTRKIAK